MYTKLLCLLTSCARVKIKTYWSLWKMSSILHLVYFITLLLMKICFYVTAMQPYASTPLFTYVGTLAASHSWSTVQMTLRSTQKTFATLQLNISPSITSILADITKTPTKWCAGLSTFGTSRMQNSWTRLSAWSRRLTSYVQYYTQRLHLSITNRLLIYTCG